MIPGNADKHRGHLLGVILEREGILTSVQIQAIVAEQERMREANEKYMPFGELAIRMNLLAIPQLRTALEIQRKIAPPAGASKRLGMYILEAKLATPSMIAQALEEQRQTGEKLGQLMVRRGWLPENVLVMLLDRQARDTGSGPLPAGAAAPARPTAAARPPAPPGLIEAIQILRAALGRDDDQLRPDVQRALGLLENLIRPAPRPTPDGSAPPARG